MSLNEDKKRQLRKLGHTLKPLVTIGTNGLTDAVYAEFDSTIAHHELIKVKVNADERENRDAMIVELCQRTNSELIQRVGHIALIFRRNPQKPKIHI